MTILKEQPKPSRTDGFFEGLGVAPAEFEGVSIVHDGLFKSATWVLTEEFLAKLETAIVQVRPETEIEAPLRQITGDIWDYGPDCLNTIWPK